MFPKLPTAVSKMTLKTGHDGVFLIKSENLESYVQYLKGLEGVTQFLRYDSKTQTLYDTLNFGECKGGLTFDRVIIFPNKTLINYLSKFTLGSPAKYYVGLTRARYSVAIIVNKFPRHDSYIDKIIGKESRILVKKFDPTKKIIKAEQLTLF